MNAKGDDSYALGRSEAETRRLMLQHRIYSPITRRFFEAAGIGTGMTVLDVGSGAGDVAMLLADLVGPRGRVVGVDMNPTILETARARAASLGVDNVTFIAGEAGEVAGGARFDAVAGRYVLMYVPDPAELLRRLAGLIRPGGIVVFHETDLNNPGDLSADRNGGDPPEGDGASCRRPGSRRAHRHEAPPAVSGGRPSATGTAHGGAARRRSRLARL